MDLGLEVKRGFDMRFEMKTKREMVGTDVKCQIFCFGNLPLKSNTQILAGKRMNKKPFDFSFAELKNTRQLVFVFLCI